MGSKISLKFVILLILFFGTHSMKIIPESMKITYINEKYFGEFHSNIRRYTRRGDYYFNIWGEIKQSWTNNVTVHIIITEYLHNEYRRSFIEFHYKFCDLINTEPMVGKMLVQKGIVCPTPKGQYRLMNMTVLSHNFPNKWPFEKGGGDLKLTSDTGETMITSYVHVLFKQNKT